MAEISAPAMVFSDAKLVANNAAAALLCKALDSELEGFAQKALQLFTPSQTQAPLLPGLWRTAQLSGDAQAISLRAQSLSANESLVLLLADMPALHEVGKDLLPESDLLACLDELPVEIHIREADSGRFLYANRTELRQGDKRGVKNVVGKTPEQVYSNSKAALVRRSDRQLAEDPSQPLVSMQRIGESEYRESRKLLCMPERRAPLIVRLAEDIQESSLTKAERAHLRRTEAIARVGSYRLSLDNARLYASGFLRNILGIKHLPEELELDDLLQLFSESDADKLQEMHLSLLDDRRTASTEITFAKSDGTTLVLEVRSKTLRDKLGKPISIYGAVLDVTARVEKERRVRFMAYHDALTELPNRAMFMEESVEFLTRAVRHKENFALHLLDLDGFKALNDRLGHLAGDRVLQVVAERLSANIRKGDVAFRLGGDEFAILHRGICSIEVVERLGERLVSTVSEPFQIGSEQVTIGASLGGAIYAGDESVQHMLLRADEMLYAVKRSGKGAFRLAS